MEWVFFGLDKEGWDGVVDCKGSGKGEDWGSSSEFYKVVIMGEELIGLSVGDCSCEKKPVVLWGEMLGSSVWLQDESCCCIEVVDSDECEGLKSGVSGWNVIQIR